MFDDEEADVRRENARPTEHDAPVKIIRIESRHGVYRKQERVCHPLFFDN